jgi:lipoprotein signal peptidase
MKNVSSLNWFLISFGLIVFDQASKLFMLKYFEDLIFLNYGIAFSLPVPTWITVTVACVLTVSILTLKFRNLLEKDYLWAILMAGAIGNMIDRVRIGAVIDFINLGFFPIFNFADIFLTVSAILIGYFYILIPMKNDFK